MTSDKNEKVNPVHEMLTKDRSTKEMVEWTLDPQDMIQEFQPLTSCTGGGN